MRFPPVTSAYFTPWLWPVLASLSDAPRLGDPGELTLRCISGMSLSNVKSTAADEFFQEQRIKSGWQVVGRYGCSDE